MAVRAAVVGMPGLETAESQTGQIETRGWPKRFSSGERLCAVRKKRADSIRCWVTVLFPLMTDLSRTGGVPEVVDLKSSSEAEE